MKEPAVVLFACVHNAGRSQLAAAWLNRLADPSRARAVSAGTQPAQSVNPEVAGALAQDGVLAVLPPPRRLTPELAATASLVVTMGCGESCPTVPGLEALDWPVEDPRGRSAGEVLAISRTIRGLVERLLDARGWR